MGESGKTMLHGVLESEAHEMADSLDNELLGSTGRDYRWKKRLPHYVPGLTAQPFWDAEQFALGRALEEASPIIADEIASLYNDTKKWKAVVEHTQAKDSKLLLNSTWVDLSIFSGGRFNDESCLAMPRTCDLLKSQLDVVTNPPALALVSEMKPGAEVGEHVGVTNAALTFHLGIRVPAEGSGGIRVGNQERQWKEGKVLVFDDSFNHSVWHSSREDAPRTVLLVRAWHPEVSIRERRVALDLMKHGGTRTPSPWRDVDL